MEKIIDTIIIHCSDSDLPEHDDINVITQWHKERGFRTIGYQYFITNNGEVHIGRKVGETGAHAKGYNENSIGICVSGRYNFEEEQFNACASLIDDLLETYEISTIVPHNFVNKEKTCPNFNIVENVLTRIGR